MENPHISAYMHEKNRRLRIRYMQKNMWKLTEFEDSKVCQRFAIKLETFGAGFPKKIARFLKKKKYFLSTFYLFKISTFNILAIGRLLWEILYIFVRGL